RCLAVEDSVAGVTSARAAGMAVIGFTGGAHTWPDHAAALRDAGAGTTVARMPDLPAAVASLRP
ncbi:MAG: HAD family hydrolase, partial [Alphaproteobacteria bacterium]|nr:HAD family hydrolase [Alphaproteobacteria bacterium]